MAETRVDLLRLLEDLRDAYPGAIEETILTEIIANALDSGATVIQLTADAAAASFTIVDNGSGMPRRDLRRHYEPLLDPACDPLLGEHYPRGISFEVNGELLPGQACRSPETLTIARPDWNYYHFQQR